ncbi:MAG: hypothetical protein M1812_004046 [Candelaria pacifica]|nr:MAG: hypothetical protein M1812_004046 [Candelaria pacifica]
MESDHSLKTVESKGASVSHASGGKIPYPKHVWSPAGGWYSQPANWKANTAVMATVVIGITALAWSTSAERETRDKFPEEGRFFPSRLWSKQIIEHEKAVKARGEQ